MPDIQANERTWCAGVRAAADCGTDRPETLPTISVTLAAGDILYLPFGWWHEVHSHPDAAKGGLCASVSHFYLPFYCRLADKRTTTLGPLMIHLSLIHI